MDFNFLSKIHEQKKELTILAEKKGSFQHEEVLKKAKELDELIIQYLKEKKLEKVDF
ncbi:MAG: Spo0E family sporulation regulatory protein-aspartic acid phosphatase [Peptococcales bacterium]|jgi:hypothetical protein